jgi:hypothetical protein
MDILNFGISPLKMVEDYWAKITFYDVDSNAVDTYWCGAFFPRLF